MKEISLYNLSFLIFPLLLVGYFYYKWIGDKKEVFYASFRMVIQLLAIGYILLYIFENKNIFLGIAIIIFMIVVSTFITIRNLNNKKNQEFFILLSSLALSGVMHLVFLIEFILELENFYEPRYVIALAGMIFASIMTALSLAAERFEKEFSEKKDFFKAREIAFKSSMIPQINSLLAVGLVALPGMMTGQILSGVDPLVAVRYQIVIMAILFSSAALGVVTYFLLKKRFI